MSRDTVSAYRARAKANEDSISAELRRQKTASDTEYREIKERAAQVESERVRLTRDDIVGATHIVDQFGKLRTVVRVNQKTVSVTTEWSWTETVPFDRVRVVKR